MPNEIHFAPKVTKEIFKKLHLHNLAQYCFPILLLSPLKEDETLHFKMFEPPLLMDTLCQVWLKLAKWFLIKRFLIVATVFSLCGYYLPLGKTHGPLIEQILIPFTQKYFVSCLVEIGLLILEKIFKSCFQFVAIISP